MSTSNLAKVVALIALTVGGFCLLLSKGRNLSASNHTGAAIEEGKPNGSSVSAPVLKASENALDALVNGFAPAKPIFGSAAIQDGDWILSSPVPEFQMTFRALTNSGVSVEGAKGLLRPMIGHLHVIAAIDEYIRRSDAEESKELDDVRKDEFYQGLEKEQVLKSTSVLRRHLRETWTARKEKRMEEFSGFVNRLGVANPDELIKDLLLIQPQSPAPDPKPE